MARVLLLSIAFSLGASACFAQDVADAARQAKKDKDAAKAPKKVYTNDDVASRLSDAPPFALASLETAKPESSSPSPGKDSAAPSGAAKSDQSKAGEQAKELNLNKIIDEVEHQIEGLDGLDIHDLAKNVLGKELDVPFEGRQDWEMRMFDAKKEFVEAEKDALKELKRYRDDRQFNTDDVLKPLRASLQKLQQVAAEGQALARQWLSKQR